MYASQYFSIYLLRLRTFSCMNPHAIITLRRINDHVKYQLMSNPYLNILELSSIFTELVSSPPFPTSNGSLPILVSFLLFYWRLYCILLCLLYSKNRTETLYCFSWYWLLKSRPVILLKVLHSGLVWLFPHCLIQFRIHFGV